MKEMPAGTADEITMETTSDMSTRHLPLPMYATPALVAHIEGLAVKMLLPYQEPGEVSVGFRVEVRHLAPTPIGMKVTIKERLREQDGRKVILEVEAFNESGTKIADGLHERRVIDGSRFGGPRR